MKKNMNILLAAALILITQSVFGQVSSDIESQNKKGNAVFLVVTDGGNDLASTKEIAMKAKTLYSKSVVLTLDKSDKANAELVKKYGLAGSITPMILVIASNGVVTDGYPKEQATPEKLVGGLPTKRQAEALLAFNQNKPAFVVLSKKSMTDKNATIEECKKASTALNGNAVVVDVNLDDKSEASFIALLNPDLAATKTNVMVFTSKGQFSSKFEAPVQSAALITAAKKAPGGCCPPGSGKSCPPKK
jgi:hypothetical protein